MAGLLWFSLRWPLPLFCPTKFASISLFVIPLARQAFELIGGIRAQKSKTDILGYSDPLGTREKCHCKQIFAYSDTFW